ncbi:cell division protein FtsL [Arvimicrobium flavum]|uniref:cell division protein FtsL n=1 Tax=Arvimicrobium flavum TaxID=3393320 RepID=UPI00237C1677|nr:hypothetical protein [Mesorhizobium shangrilense]
MFRTSDMIMLAVIVASAAFTYKTKHEAENRLSEIRKIEAQIRFEEDTIDVLKADWSLLTQPVRLERLVKAYETELGLKTVEATQIVRLSDLPERPLTIEDLVSDPAAMAGLETDPVVTGTVAQ